MYIKYIQIYSQWLPKNSTLSQIPPGGPLRGPQIAFWIVWHCFCSAILCIYIGASSRIILNWTRFVKTSPLAVAFLLMTALSNPLSGDQLFQVLMGDNWIIPLSSRLPRVASTPTRESVLPQFVLRILAPHTAPRYEPVLIAFKMQTRVRRGSWLHAELTTLLLSIGSGSTNNILSFSLPMHPPEAHRAMTVYHFMYVHSDWMQH